MDQPVKILWRQSRSVDYLEGLGIDKDMQVVGMVGMGYPDEEREAAKRQDDLVTYLN